MPTLRERFQKRARLDELGVLVEVAEAGSLSAAAKRLRVPKSTVGRAVRRGEEDLGHPSAADPRDGLVAGIVVNLRGGHFGRFLRERSF